MPMIRGLLPPIAVGVVARDGHRLFLCAAIFEPRHAPVDPGQAPIPPTPAWKRINCAHCSPFHLVVCSRHCHAMHARPVSTLEGISPHPRAPGPSTPTPQEPTWATPQPFPNDPWAPGPFSQAADGHPSSNFQGPTQEAPSSRLPACFQLPFVFPSRPLLYSLHSRLCLHTAKRHRREAFGCRQLAVVSNRG